jgi:hypothetical protein
LRTLRTFAAVVVFASGHALAVPSGSEPFSCDWKAEVPGAIDSARLVVFGELHGTVESPAMVGEYVCHLSRSAPSVYLALEIPSAEQAAIDRYLSSGGAADDRARLLVGPFWRGVADGRNSSAMAALIERVRQVRNAGKDAGIVAIDINGRDATTRDAAMAENLQAAMRKHPDARFVALVGSAHASRGNASAPRPPMAHYFPAEGVVTIAVESLPGRAWVCGNKGCGLEKVGGWRKPGSPEGFRMGMAAMPGFDGSFGLGAVTASMPSM